MGSREGRPKNFFHSPPPHGCQYSLGYRIVRVRSFVRLCVCVYVFFYVCVGRISYTRDVRLFTNCKITNKTNCRKINCTDCIFKRIVLPLGRSSCSSRPVAGQVCHPRPSRPFWALPPIPSIQCRFRVKVRARLPLSIRPLAVCPFVCAKAIIIVPHEHRPESGPPPPPPWKTKNLKKNGGK